MSRLTTVEWWRDLGVLALRQALQAILPIIIALQATAASGEHPDLAQVGEALLGAVAVTMFFAVVRGIRDSGDPTPIGMILRAGAGVLAVLPITDLSSFTTTDWYAVGLSAALAMVISALHLRVDPPVLERQRLALAA